jgi:malate dehydrogenase (oxaloacetate-decarboxylating)(NADP+)
VLFELGETRALSGIQHLTAEFHRDRRGVTVKAGQQHHFHGLKTFAGFFQLLFQQTGQGVSAKNGLPPELVAGMAARPVIFALANPDPEILPDQVHAIRDDAIMATGRSDFPNQVNNALCFPYLFRGALDAQATQISEEMKVAAARALSDLAREPVPQQVLDAYQLQSLSFGKDYIIPKPFDPRLMAYVSGAVARAAKPV